MWPLTWRITRPCCCRGSAAPSYPHERVTDVNTAVALVERGKGVHVDTQEQIVQVLRRLGLTEHAMQVRIHFARTGSLWTSCDSVAQSSDGPPTPSGAAEGPFISGCRAVLAELHDWKVDEL